MAGRFGGIPEGRADTFDKKIAVLERLLTTWQKTPSLRLGQLIMCSMTSGSDVFVVEDEKLIENIELFVNNHMIV